MTTKCLPTFAFYEMIEDNDMFGQIDNVYKLQNLQLVPSHNTHTYWKVVHE